MKCLWMLFVLASVIKLGESLKCYENSLAPSHCKMKAITCDYKTNRCFKRVGMIMKMAIASRGCIPMSNCKRSVSNTFAGMAVTLKTSCCLKDLCNGGRDLTLSLALGAALLPGWFLCVNV